MPHFSVLSPAELQVVTDRKDEFVAAADQAKASAEEGVLQQHQQVMRAILGYVRDKSRVLYGGYAMHLLMFARDGKGLYDGRAKFMDVDFYSSTPVHDVRELCDALYDAGFTYVNAKNSIHEETYSVFVCSHKFCDITYMPPKALRQIPTARIDGILLTHPRVITTDMMKMLCTPLASYWRLDKTLDRMGRLFLHYPLDIPLAKCQPPAALTDQGARLAAAGASQLALLPVASVLWLGAAAARVLLGGPGAAAHFIGAPTAPLEAVVDADFRVCAREAALAMRAAAPEAAPIKIEIHAPFLSYLGQHAILSCDDEALLTIYEGQGDALSYVEDAGAHVASAFTQIYFALVKHYQAWVNGNTPALRVANWYLVQLLSAWRAATAADAETVAKEFLRPCQGRYESPQQRFFFRNVLRNVRCRSSISPYRPAQESAPRLDPSKYRFRNTSGATVDREIFK